MEGTWKGNVFILPLCSYGFHVSLVYFIDVLLTSYAFGTHVLLKSMLSHSLASCCIVVVGIDRQHWDTKQLYCISGKSENLKYKTSFWQLPSAMVVLSQMQHNWSHNVISMFYFILLYQTMCWLISGFLGSTLLHYTFNEWINVSLYVMYNIEWFNYRCLLINSKWTELIWRFSKPGSHFKYITVNVLSEWRSHPRAHRTQTRHSTHTPQGRGYDVRCSVCDRGAAVVENRGCSDSVVTSFHCSTWWLVSDACDTKVTVFLTLLCV